MRFHPREHPVQAGHADVVHAFHAVAHDFGGDGGFLGHRQIARAGADDGDEAGALAAWFFLDGHAAGDVVMDGAFEFFLQRAGVFGGDAGDEHWLSMLQQFGGDLDDLFRRLARAENHFGKIFAERAVRVHLRETEVGHGRGLKCAAEPFRAGFFRRGIAPAVALLRSLSSWHNASRNAGCHAGIPLDPPFDFRFRRLPAEPAGTIFRAMKYRRFGRTELQMPVISCGGMRYQHKWQDVPPQDIPRANQENLEACIHRALELGINHIETARGYGTSEMQLGAVLPKLPRDKMIVQTKVAPKATAEEFLKTFETSMDYLKLDHVDLLSLHGINNRETLDWSLQKGGCLEAARKLQKEGRCRFIGFSTHATDGHHFGGRRTPANSITSTSTGILSTT